MNQSPRDDEVVVAAGRDDEPEHGALQLEDVDEVGKVKKRILEIEQELSEIDQENEIEKLSDLLSEKISLDNVNKLLLEKLGRIISG